MSFGTWADSKVRNLGWVDVRLIKLSAMGFILTIAKLWKPLLSLRLVLVCYN